MSFDPATAQNTFLWLVQDAYFEYYTLNNIQTPLGYPPFSKMVENPPFIGVDKLTKTSVLNTIYIPDNTKTEYFFGWVVEWTVSGTTYVAFVLRGTEGFGEWFQDFDMIQTDFCPGSSETSVGKVHAGWNLYYSQLQYYPASGIGAASTLQDIFENLDATVVVTVTGHSLGAALATLLAVDISVNQNSSVDLYTFASPVVGDPDFAAYFNNLANATNAVTNYRVANGWDIIPNMPPPRCLAPVVSLLDLPQSVYEYQQVGGLQAIDGGFTIDPLEAHSTSAYNAGLLELVPNEAVPRLLPPDALSSRPPVPPLRSKRVLARPS